MKKILWLLNFSTVLFLAAALSAGEIPVVELKLTESERGAINNSPRIKSAAADDEAYEKRAKSLSAQLYPKLVLEGNYQYFTNVSEIKIPIAGLGSIKLGDINNYTVGPSLYWTAWDHNALRNSYNSAREAADSRKMEKEVIERQVILAARSSFFQAGLAKDEVTLFSDALKLAQSEYNDIKINVRVGSKSRKDEISAHQEVLSKLKQLRQARAELSQALNELSAVTGVPYGENILLPMDSSLINDLPKEIAPPTIYIGMEPTDSIIEIFNAYRSKKLWEDHPDIVQYEKLAQSARLLSKSATDGLWPRFNINAKTYLQYPNGPILETITQNTVGVSLTWSIFEGNDSRSKAEENKFISESNEELKEQKKIDLKKDWQNIEAALANLDDQEALNEQSAAEAKDLADMTYKSYKIGSATFIEVEDANYKLLDAKIQLARTKFQKLVNLATLASLAQ